MKRYTLQDELGPVIKQVPIKNVPVKHLKIGRVTERSHARWRSVLRTLTRAGILLASVTALVACPEMGAVDGSETQSCDTQPVWYWTGCQASGTGVFRYRINDSEWVIAADLEPDGDNRYSYSIAADQDPQGNPRRLYPGTYQFEVQERNIAGNWSQSSTQTTRILVQPPVITGGPDGTTADPRPSFTWSTGTPQQHGNGITGRFSFRLERWTGAVWQTLPVHSATDQPVTEYHVSTAAPLPERLYRFGVSELNAGGERSAFFVSPGLGTGDYVEFSVVAAGGEEPGGYGTLELRVFWWELDEIGIDTFQFTRGEDTFSIQPEDYQDSGVTQYPDRLEMIGHLESGDWVMELVLYRDGIEYFAHTETISINEDTITPREIMSYSPDSPTNLTAYRGQNDQTYRFLVTGNESAGTVWGTDIYTDDSNLATAAVHAGALAHEQTGVVIVRILPGQDNYVGSVRNGVTSAAWVSFSGSFEFVLP
jgi:hypothetical protein